MCTSSILVTWPAQRSCTWSKMGSMLGRLDLLRTSSFQGWIASCVGQTAPVAWSASDREPGCLHLTGGWERRRPCIPGSLWRGGASDSAILSLAVFQRNCWLLTSGCQDAYQGWTLTSIYLQVIQRITSGLNTNSIYLQVIHYKSFYHKSFFLSLFIFLGH